MSCYSKTFAFYPGEAKTLEVALKIKLGSCKTIRRLIPMVRASLIVQDLTYTSFLVGIDGNAITIAYTSGGTAGSEIVSVTGNAISVQIASGTSTATQVKTAIQASTAASALVTVVVSGTGSNTQVTASAAPLAGGAGDKISIQVPATPDDLVFDYNSTPEITIVDQYLGEIEVALTATQTNQMISGPMTVNVTDDTGKLMVYMAADGITKLKPVACACDHEDDDDE